MMALLLDQRGIAGAFPLPLAARPFVAELSLGLSGALSCMPRMIMNTVVTRVFILVFWFVRFLAWHRFSLRNHGFLAVVWMILLIATAGTARFGAASRLGLARD